MQRPFDMFATRPSGTLCDACRRLIWHANGDGYCCCTAPGMERINAKTRKPLGSACRFYEEVDR